VSGCSFFKSARDQNEESTPGVSTRVSAGWRILETTLSSRLWLGFFQWAGHIVLTPNDSLYYSARRTTTVEYSSSSSSLSNVTR
jgi:hypothetical protein